MTSFRFEFNGNVQPDANPVSVRNQLARRFGVPEAKLSELMLGNAQFVRDPLDETTARLYQKTFEQLGALCKVSRVDTPPEDTIPTDTANTLTATAPQVENTSTFNISADAKTSYCPKCNAPESIQNGQCTHCGIYVEKFLARSTTAPIADVINTKNEGGESSSERQEAVKWLSISVTAMLCVSIADEYLTQFMAPSHIGFDIGPIPYIVAYLLLCYGCILYADTKGYSFKVGLLGLLNFAGLSILLLLPDKKAPDRTKSLPQFVFAVLSILYSVYWAHGQYVSIQTKDTVFEAASVLGAGRESYPSTILQSSNDVYEQEFSELIQFSESTLKALQENHYRNTSAIRIANELMSAVVNFRYWLNNQTHLHQINSQATPDSLSSRSINRHAIAIKEIFDSYLEKMPKTGPVAKTIQDWYTGNESVYASPTKPQQQLLDAVQEIQKQIRQKRSDLLIDVEGQERPTLNLSALTLKDTSHIRFSTDRTHIVIEVLLKPGKVKKIALGLSLSSRSQVFRKQYHHINLSVLNSEIDNIHLRGALNVISSSEIPGANYF